MGEEDTEPPTPEGEGWPEQGPLASLAEPPPSEASWVHVPSGSGEIDETSTVANFTLEDVPQVDPPSWDLVGWVGLGKAFVGEDSGLGWLV